MLIVYIVTIDPQRLQGIQECASCSAVPCDTEAMGHTILSVQIFSLQSTTKRNQIYLRRGERVLPVQDPD